MQWKATLELLFGAAGLFLSVLFHVLCYRKLLFDIESMNIRNSLTRPLMLNESESQS
jgi:hypothetical protein